MQMRGGPAVQMTSDAPDATDSRNARRKLILSLLMLGSAVGGCTTPREPQTLGSSSEQILNPASAAVEPADVAQPAGSHAVPAPLVVQASGMTSQQADRRPPADESGIVSSSDISVFQVEPFEHPTPDRRGLPMEQHRAAEAQPVERFITLALQGHPRVAAARDRVAAAAQQIPQARALADPMLNNTFWPITDQALQTAGGRIAHQTSLSQQVPWPEKLRARAAIAQREVEVARAEQDRVEREITEAVRLAYYELWYATQAIQIIQDNRDLVDDLIRVAETRYRTGGSQQDVLRAQLEAEKLEDQLITLRRQLQVAQADLSVLVQLPLDLNPQPVEDLSLPVEPGQLDALVAAAVRCNPELRGLQWQIARDRERQRLACLQRYPDFQLGAGWSLVTEEDALSPVANGHDNINFTLGVMLPIWRDKIDAGIREAAANTAATVRLHDAERDELYGRLRRLLAQAEALLQQLDLYRDRIVPRTERTLQLATADYRGERVDFYSLIEIYQELLMYQMQIARMEASLAGTLAQVERAVGCPMELATAP